MIFRVSAGMDVIFADFSKGKVMKCQPIALVDPPSFIFMQFNLQFSGKNV